MSAANIVDLVRDIAEVVQTLDEDDEQSEDNLETLTNVYSQIEELVESNQINVTNDVSWKIVALWPFIHSTMCK